jgi:O-acetylserine/cysteine efflux transporter
VPAVKKGEEKIPMNRKDFVLALFVVTIWGANFTVIKLGLGGVPPVPLFLLALMLDTPKTIFGAIMALNGVSVFSIFYLAFGATLFGYGAWSKLLSRHPANAVAPLSLLVPVTGLLTASLVLGEQLSLLQWGGCLTVIFGLLVATFGLQPFRRLAQDQVR